MPGYTDKSRQYLRLAVENYKRAGAAESEPGMKAKFCEIAARYRDLALQMDDPQSGVPAFLSPRGWGWRVLELTQRTDRRVGGSP
jgi:hypothetical protein